MRYIATFFFLRRQFSLLLQLLFITFFGEASKMKRITSVFFGLLFVAVICHATINGTAGTQSFGSTGWTGNAYDSGNNPASPGPNTGLNFPSNNTANADIRLVWDGANILPRTSHTAIWKAQYVQQSGYYAVTWHTSNDGTWHGSEYEYGVHPFPCDGGYNGLGQATGGTGSSGTVHYQEIAGLGVQDLIQGPGNPFLLIKDGRWLTQARQSWISGGTVYQREYPDVVNAPGTYVEKTVTQTAYNSAAAAAVSPAFMIGCSPWTVSGNTNEECPSGVIRGIRLFSDGQMSITDIAAEAVANDNTPATSAGSASVWYINDNPTPTDVADKSGAGHNPTWANSNRPTLWTE